MAGERTVGASVSRQRRWALALLIVGGVGFFTAVAMKVAGTTADTKSLLFFSLGLVCLSLGLGFRLDWKASRPRLRPVQRLPRSPVSVAEPTDVPSTALVLTGVGLIALSWLLSAA